MGGRNGTRYWWLGPIAGASLIVSGALYFSNSRLGAFVIIAQGIVALTLAFLAGVLWTRDGDRNRNTDQEDRPVQARLP